MIITKQDKDYLINTKIKILEGKKNRYLNGDPEMLDSLSDIESQIEVLTNLRKMI
jgi:hypothetical protein